MCPSDKKLHAFCHGLNEYVHKFSTFKHGSQLLGLGENKEFGPYWRKSISGATVSFPKTKFAWAISVYGS